MKRGAPSRWMPCQVLYQYEGGRTKQAVVVPDSVLVWRENRAGERAGGEESNCVARTAGQNGQVLVHCTEVRVGGCPVKCDQRWCCWVPWFDGGMAHCQRSLCHIGMVLY
jgi:hypothetical protein